MNLKNRYGQTVTLKELLFEVTDPIYHAQDMDRNAWLDNKAYCIYIKRFEAAEDAGASDDEMDAINAQNVRYTFFDEIQRRFYNSNVGSFALALWHFYTDEPDYSGLRYG